MFKKEIVILLMIFIIPSVHAEIFNVGVSVTGSCTPTWQCTAFSKTTCGTRDCVDINICGVNTDRPDEFVACERQSGSTGPESINETHSFRLSYDLLKEEMKPDSFVSRRIKIYHDSGSENSYDVSIKSTNQEFIRMVSVSKDKILEDKEFNLMINTSGSIDGVYNGVIVVDSEEYSRSINVIIKILSDGPGFKISFNEVNTILNASTILIPIIELNDTEKFVNITYSFLSDIGEELFTFSSLNTQGSSINMPMPAGLRKGYYTLKVSVQSGDSVNTQYETFYADPDNTLLPYVEETKDIFDFKIKNALAFSILIVVIILIVLLSIKYYPSIKNNLLLKKNSSNSSDIIQKSYEQGFINRQELDAYNRTKNGLSNTPNAKEYAIETSIISQIIEGNKIDENEKEPYKKEEDTGTNSSKKNKLLDLSDVKCPSGKEFILHDGSKIYSIKELFDKLPSMEEDIFYHHVTPERNDFANWIRDVFKEEGLAFKVSVCKTRREMECLF